MAAPERQASAGFDSKVRRPFKQSYGISLSIAVLALVP